ncbi:MAG: DUF6434 domain-containing protein [Roseiflexaceae bacterium]
MARPALTIGLPAADFRSFYWLKDELLAFCRAHQLSTQGGKQVLAERIATFLETGARSPAAAQIRRPSRMPATFTRETIIEENWRCSQSLRAFFQVEIGSHFHFDQVMRDFIQNGAGKSLQEAINTWQQPRPTTTIAPQFEYNRHMRAFFAAKPNATREEAIRAWNAEKALRRPQPTQDDDHA